MKFYFYTKSERTILLLLGFFMLAGTLLLSANSLFSFFALNKADAFGIIASAAAIIISAIFFPFLLADPLTCFEISERGIKRKCLFKSEFYGWEDFAFIAKAVWHYKFHTGDVIIFSKDTANQDFKFRLSNLHRPQTKHYFRLKCSDRLEEMLYLYSKCYNGYINDSNGKIVEIYNLGFK